VVVDDRVGITLVMQRRVRLTHCKMGDADVGARIAADHDASLLEAVIDVFPKRLAFGAADQDVDAHRITQSCVATSPR
jgi:hypothetical protein